MTLQRDDERDRVARRAAPAGLLLQSAKPLRILLPWIGIGVVLALVLGAMALLITLLTAFSGTGVTQNCTTTAGGGGAPDAAAGAPAPAAGGGGDVVGLSPVQLETAQAIVGVAKGLGIGTRGQTIALITARQESVLGTAGMFEAVDHDSLGAFQQRAAWGPASARIDVAQSAAMFFNGGQGGQPGLLDLEGWEQMPVTEAAQSVQRSAFPDAYAKWEPLAASLLTQLAGVPAVNPPPGAPAAQPGDPVGVDAPAPCAPAAAAPAAPGAPVGPVPGGAAGAAIQFALGQQGKPYVWGATGPDSFDCSGLTLRAFQSAGIDLPRVSREQYNAGQHVPAAQAQPGDLLFFAYDPQDPATIHHVMIYMGNNQIVEAQQTGVPVHTREFNVQTGGDELVPLATRPGT